MNKFIRLAIGYLLPFSTRRWLAQARLARGVPGLLGRICAGGLQASISSKASARMWRQVQVGRESIVDAGVYFHTNDNCNVVRVRIDRNCFIGRNCYFSAGESIHISSYCNVGAACNLLAAGHEYDIPTIPYSVAPVVSYGHMKLGTNTWIGSGSTLVGNICIGYGSIVAAGSLLRRSLPPLCLAAGTPAVPIKLYDWHSRRWIRLPQEGAELDIALAKHLATIPTEAEYVRLLKI